MTALRLILVIAGVLAVAGPASAQSAVRPPENLILPPYSVLGVPTGSVVTDFTRAIEPAFGARPGVSAAFLCWVRYGDEPQPALALLIVGPHDPALMEAIGAVFARMSGPQDSIDMIFIGPGEAADLWLAPIYSRDGPQP